MQALIQGNPPIAARNNLLAKGTEVEINFNPTRLWTVAANVADTQSINSGVGTTIGDWLATPLPIWTTIRDPLTGQLWWNTVYAGQTPAQRYPSFIEAPYALLKQQEGKALTQIRRYSAKLSTRLQLAGLTEHVQLKRVSVGGALRWKDKGAIGYYGKDYERLLATNQPITELDTNRPVWDKGHVHVDAFVGYRMRLWSDRIATTLQLNVRILQESGRLQPIGVYPDGTPHTYRIVDPRQFILTATFEL